MPSCQELVSLTMALYVTALCRVQWQLKQDRRWLGASDNFGVSLIKRHENTDHKVLCAGDAKKLSTVDRQIYRYIWSRTYNILAKGRESKQQAALPNLCSSHLMADSRPSHHKGISSSISCQKNCSRLWAGKYNRCLFTSSLGFSSFLQEQQ